MAVTGVCVKAKGAKIAAEFALNRGREVNNPGG
jgi:hypothetical protein